MNIQINKKCQFCREEAVFCFSNLLGTVTEITGDKYWNWSRLDPVNIFTCANHRVEYRESMANGDPIITEDE